MFHENHVASLNLVEQPPLCDSIILHESINEEEEKEIEFIFEVSYHSDDSNQSPQVKDQLVSKLNENRQQNGLQTEQQTSIVSNDDPNTSIVLSALTSEDELNLHNLEIESSKKELAKEIRQTPIVNGRGKKQMPVEYISVGLPRRAIANGKAIPEKSPTTENDKDEIVDNDKCLKSLAKSYSKRVELLQPVIHLVKVPDNLLISKDNASSLAKMQSKLIERALSRNCQESTGSQVQIKPKNDALVEMTSDDDIKELLADVKPKLPRITAKTKRQNKRQTKKRKPKIVAPRERTRTQLRLKEEEKKMILNDEIKLATNRSLRSYKNKQPKAINQVLEAKLEPVEATDSDSIPIVVPKRKRQANNGRFKRKKVISSDAEQNDIIEVKEESDEAEINIELTSQSKKTLQKVLKSLSSLNGGTKLKLKLTVVE